MNSITGENLSNGVTRWLQDHLQTIETKIRNEAESIAKNEKREDVEPGDIASAAMLYAPGRRFPAARDELDIPFWKRMALSITGVTLVSGLLAVVFGIIGYLAGKLGQGQQFATGAFDIAKIFAGAVVGSTGAGVAATAKRG